MLRCRILSISIATLTLAATQAPAATLEVFPSFDAWAAAAASYQTLDFAAERVLSDSDNYASEGVVFSSVVGTTLVLQTQGELRTRTQTPFGDFGGNQQLEIVFPDPVHFVAAQSGGDPESRCFGGCTGLLGFASSLVAYDEEGNPILPPDGTYYPLNPQRLRLGDFFAIASEVPIARILIAGVNSQVIGGSSAIWIETFWFTPVPEPASILLCAAGLAWLSTSRREGRSRSPR